MSEEQNKRLFEHYTAVVSGSVKSANSVSNELIVSDAKVHLADLIKKNPSLAELAEVKQPEEEEKEVKSKVKK